MTSRSQLFEALRFFLYRRKRNLVVIHGRVESGILVRLTSGYRDRNVPSVWALGYGQVADAMDQAMDINRFRPQKKMQPRVLLGGTG